MYYYVLCREAKGRGDALFIIGFAKDVFPGLSLEERIMAIHDFASGAHDTQELHPNNLWTEQSLQKFFPEVPVEYINSPEEFAALKERLASEGWAWEDKTVSEGRKAFQNQLAPVYGGRQLHLGRCGSVALWDDYVFGRSGGYDDDGGYSDEADFTVKEISFLIFLMVLVIVFVSPVITLAGKIRSIWKSLARWAAKYRN